MSRSINSLLAFNRGLVDRRGLARIDLKRLAMSAQIQTNWMPRVLGSMTLRPGLGFLGSTNANLTARFLPFVFATDDTALIEFTDSTMRVWVNDQVVTRTAVSSTVTNGTFIASLAGWTISDELGGSSTWQAINTVGTAQLVGDGANRAILDQNINVLAADQNKEHALRIVILRGPVTLRVGVTKGDDAYINETVLQTGTYSLSFTPASSFWIRFFSAQIPKVWISQCTIELAGVMSITSPYTASDLNNIRVAQSADVLFLACKGISQRRIERRGKTSWGIGIYAATNGPFNIENIGPVSISASALVGNITITASQPIFRINEVGGLYSLTSLGQQVTDAISSQNTFSNFIKVTNAGNANRRFAVTITGTFVANITVQRSLDMLTWNDLPGVYTAPINDSIYDGLDNQIVYYRIGIKTGDYTSGTATCSLIYTFGDIRGIVRVTDFIDTMNLGVEVLSALGGTFATVTWEKGQWSPNQGYPTSVAFYEGRLWWSGKNGFWGSVSDAYDSFDEEFVGDAGPINRTIGSGPVDTINWILPLQRLLLGAQGAEFSVRSSALDEPLTPTNLGIKESSNQGSTNVQGIKIDQSGVFVNRSGVKVYQLDFNLQTYDYGSKDITQLVPELNRPGIVRMDSHRQPDTRIHCVRSDGVVTVAISDTAEDVLAWIMVTSPGAGGLIEDVVTLPALNGNSDDQVYYVVNRVINGVTKRYLEKWAQELDCRGDKPLCFLADSYVSQTFSTPQTVIPNLGNLEGQQVVVWADSADVGTNDSVTPWTLKYTVVGGQITLPVAVTNVVVGLPYSAPFQSTKLGSQNNGSPLNQKKNISQLGIVACDIHRQGLAYGADFDLMDNMPLVEHGVANEPEVRADYDESMITFPGKWTTDSRVCLQAQAPRPVTLLAATYDMVE